MLNSKPLLQLVYFALSCFLCASGANAEDWTFLDTTEGNMIGVRNISLEHSGDFSGYYYVDVLNGYLPDGRYEDGNYIGSRIRGSLMNCSISNAYLLEDKRYDKRFNVISEFLARDKSSLEAKSQAISGDAALEKARNFVCSRQNTPNKIAHLSCHVNNDDITLTVDYSNRTVNKIPAEITDSMITFKIGGGPSFIDRHNGALHIKTPEGELVRIGFCSPKTERQF